VLFKAGDHVPVMPLFDVVGIAFNVSPEQIADTCVKVGVTIGLSTIVTLFEIASEPTRHGVAFDVISQVITSPFTNEPEVNVELFCPGTTASFFFQTYIGELPPFVGVAVTVIALPWQAPVADAEIETLAVKTGFTTMVTPFDVAGEPVKHGVAFDVITHVITSPFTNDVVEYVEAIAPDIVVPFFFQT
jgi:hypothetical protein